MGGLTHVHPSGPITTESTPSLDPGEAMRRWNLAAVVAVMLIAATLRFGGITGVGIKFVDEASYTRDARLWHRCARTLMDPTAVRAIIRGDKPVLQQRMDEIGVDFTSRFLGPKQGYTFLGSLMMFVVGDRPAALLVVNALCGTLAVGALYAVGTVLFGRGVALCAALFMAISPYHLIYSRGARADVSAGLFCLVGVALWAIGRQRRWACWKIYGLTGVAFGYALTCHYRCGYVLPVVVLIDWLTGTGDATPDRQARSGWRDLGRRWGWLAAGVALPILAIESVFRVAQVAAYLSDSYFPVVSFLEGAWRQSKVVRHVGANLTGGSFWGLNPQVAGPYISYFAHWHGFAAAGLTLVGILVTLFARGAARLPAAVVVATAAILMLQPWTVARALSTALPFLYLCLAAGLAWVSARVARLLSTSAPVPALMVVLGCVVVTPTLGRIHHAGTRRSDLPDACALLAEQDSGSVVVPGYPRKYEVYLDGAAVEIVAGKRYRVSLTPAEALTRMRRDGVRWIITDPQRWQYRHPTHLSRDAVFHWWQDLDELLSREAVVFAEYPHLSSSLWEFLTEGAGLDYLDEMARTGGGRLKIYDLNATRAESAGQPRRISPKRTGYQLTATGCDFGDVAAVGARRYRHEETTP